ncbi:unnamed protein product [Discosporangium mesarthrocarpum]
MDSTATIITDSESDRSTACTGADQKKRGAEYMSQQSDTDHLCILFAHGRNWKQQWVSEHGYYAQPGQVRAGQGRARGMDCAVLAPTCSVINARTHPPVAG